MSRAASATAPATDRVGARAFGYWASRGLAVGIGLLVLLVLDGTSGFVLFPVGLGACLWVGVTGKWPGTQRRGNPVTRAILGLVFIAANGLFAVGIAFLSSALGAYGAEVLQWGLIALGAALAIEVVAILLAVGAVTLDRRLWRRGEDLDRSREGRPLAAGAEPQEQSTCRSCGHENAAEAGFCAACGATLAEPTPEAAGEAYAGFWTRLGAAFIDGVVIYSGILAMRALISVVGFFSYGFYLYEGYVQLAVWALVYLVLMTGLKGQTLGKMAVGIRVVREDGSVPGLGYAALREVVGKFASTIALFLGFLWIARDPEKRGWHDHIAGTRVIKVRR